MAFRAMAALISKCSMFLADSLERTQRSVKSTAAPYSLAELKGKDHRHLSLFTPFLDLCICLWDGRSVFVY